MGEPSQGGGASKLAGLLHHLSQQRAAAVEDIDRWRDATESTERGPERAALRCRQWRAENKVLELDREIDLATRVSLLLRAVEEQRENLITLHESQKCLDREALIQIQAAHDRLRADEARLRRLGVRLTEQMIGQVDWDDQTKRALAEDDELLEEDGLALIEICRPERVWIVN